MEPAQTPIDKNALRVRILLGKFPVTELRKGKDGFLMTISFPNSVKMRCDVPTVADVRLGDILSIYTEVLADPNKIVPTTPTQ